VQDRVEFGGDLVDVAGAAGPAQCGGDAGFRHCERCGGRRGELDQGPGQRCGQVAAAVGGGFKHRRVVLTQQRPQLVAGSSAPPRGVLAGAGEDRDRADEFGVGRQRPVHVQVSPEDVR
jgi:hypothetical protein